MRKGVQSQNYSHYYKKIEIWFQVNHFSLYKYSFVQHFSQKT